MNITEAADQVLMESINIRTELEEIAEREGFEPSKLTGNLFLSPIDNSLWYEVADERNTTSYVSKCYPRQTAYGETLVGAGSKEEIADFAKTEMLWTLPNE